MKRNKDYTLPKVESSKTDKKVRTHSNLLRGYDNSHFSDRNAKIKGEPKGEPEMITIVRFRHKEKNCIAFQVDYRTIIYAYGFVNGIVEVRACPGMSIEEFAKVIDGCFATFSNFESEILKFYNAKPGTKMQGIKVVFNDIYVCTATYYEHSAKNIVSKYFEQKK